MKKALLFLSLACIVVLSACGPQATATAVQSPPTTAPATAPAVPTSAPAAGPTTASPTTTTAAPTAEAACTNSASFVADVTIPDYSHLDQREAFTKTWRVKNAGTCTWTSDYKAVYSRGDALGAPLSVPLSETAPGATLDISANMAAPATDGKYEIFYQLTNAVGDPMPIDAGDSLWALVTVGKVVAYPPATPIGTASTVPVSNGSPLPAASCVYQANADFVTQALSLINAARAANGLSPLTANDKLDAAAQSHSADMACNNYLGHTGCGWHSCR